MKRIYKINQITKLANYFYKEAFLNALLFALPGVGMLVDSFLDGELFESLEKLKHDLDILVYIDFFENNKSLSAIQTIIHKIDEAQKLAKELSTSKDSSKVEEFTNVAYDLMSRLSTVPSYISESLTVTEKIFDSVESTIGIGGASATVSSLQKGDKSTEMLKDFIKTVRVKGIWQIPVIIGSSIIGTLTGGLAAPVILAGLHGALSVSQNAKFNSNVVATNLQKLVLEAKDQIEKKSNEPIKENTSYTPKDNQKLESDDYQSYEDVVI